jgi:hypothetical protein
MWDFRYLHYQYIFAQTRIYRFSGVFPQPIEINHDEPSGIDTTILILLIVKYISYFSGSV